MTGPKMSRKAKNLSLAALAALAGVASVVIIFTALILGMWIDAVLNYRGLFTIILLVLSVPVSLYTMLKIVMGSLDRITLPAPHDDEKQRAPDVEDDSR